jgi:DNA-binding transcriptional LysR family regulator
MFQQDGLAPPTNTIETAALLFMTRMLQQSDMVAVVATDVAQYYAAHGIVSILPLPMPCHMDAFGVITRADRLLSPAAKVMMKALKQASLVQYGRRLELGD